MNILLFGGAFDPPHMGHVNMLNCAVKNKNYDKIILIPTGTPAHKKKCKAPFAIRKKMTELTFDSFNNLEVSSFEGLSVENNYSYITIEHFRDCYPNAEFDFLVGGDSVISFTKWRNYKDILKNTNIVAVKRKCENKEFEDSINKLKASNANINVLNCNIIDISSSEIREKFYNKKIECSYVDKNVNQLINNNYIYFNDDIQSKIEVTKLLVDLILDNERKVHTYNVANLAKELAVLHNEDPYKAQLAALLHDICKQDRKDILLHRAMQSDIIDKIQQKQTHILHGYAAVNFAVKELSINDDNILMAIKNHTCARCGMTNLEKIVFLADKLSQERTFSGKEEQLSVAKINLDEAMIMSLSSTINYLKVNNKAIDQDSIDALDCFIKLQK